MSFRDSLVFEITCTQSELDEIELRRKQLKKRLRELSKLLQELQPYNLEKEENYEQC